MKLFGIVTDVSVLSSALWGCIRNEKPPKTLKGQLQAQFLLFCGELPLLNLGANSKPLARRSNGVSYSKA